ncbi:hypothetical protein Tco_0617096 [Tanacetum coccineum]
MNLKQTTLTMGNALREEPEASGEKSLDPLASLVQGPVTPSMTKVNASGEEQVEDISMDMSNIARNQPTRTRERMSDQEAKEIKAEAREIMPQPSTVNQNQTPLFYKHKG